MKKAKILVLGSSNTDMTVKTSHLPAPGETVLGGEFSMSEGGKGANQAVAAQRLGGNVTFITKVGNDSFGRESVANYQKEGLDTGRILSSAKPSGVALITVDAAAENCIVVASGANGDVTVEDINSCADAIKGCDILLMQLEIPIQAVCRAAGIAAESGVRVILNPAPAAELPEELYKNLYLLIPNWGELSKLSGIEITGKETLEKAASIMLDKGVDTVVATCGCRGSMIYNSQGAKYIDAVKVDAIDTTAAGDTFCGALCVGLSEGMGVEDAAVFASKAAALTVTKMGAQNSIPYRKDIR